MRRKIESAHTNFYFMLFFAQIFALFPVCGIGKGHNFLKFKWDAKRTIYSLFFAAGATFNLICQGVKIGKAEKLKFGHFVTLLFFLVTLVTIVGFLQIAQQWPTLMRKWSAVDMAMSSYGFPLNLHKKIKIIAGVVMAGAAVEYSLCLAFVIKYSHKSDNFFKFVQNYFEGYFEHVFSIIPYNICIGTFMQILNTFSTISWNFMDVFIMLISLTLSARFTQISDYINTLIKRRDWNEENWRKLREDYTKVSYLSCEVDQVISNIILLSFANNIFVVLVQLFYSTQRPPSDGALDKIYYLYSFIFLIIRTIAVALCAASVNTESKKPVHLLVFLHDSDYNIEIERLFLQSKWQTLALTGRELFKVTKSFILTVAAAIVSYELILIQFHVA